MRAEVLTEIEEMAHDRTDATLEWWKSLPQHIAQVYFDKEHQQISQIPLFIELLNMAGMPDLPTLAADLQQGFNMLGEINEGAGWLPRADQRYDFPISMTTFREHNRNYTIKKLQSGRVDDAWQVMLTELLQELDKGRMDGPFTAPDWWPVKAISLPDRDMQRLPAGANCFSFCFSVKQSDKIRRCEDFRRSGHNMTIKTGDTPHHHDVQTFAALARAYPEHAELPHVWAQDLNGAYRQFPVKDPCECLCVLQTPEGPLILRHFALSFGATASVWSFNRSADAMTFLARRLLGIAIGHYVDDFIAIEPHNLAASSFQQFTRFSRLLGLRMKESKALAPNPNQKVLGVLMEVTQTEVILRPHPSRCAKVLAIIDDALQQNRLTNDEAQRLAGKLVFLTSTLFGQLGRAALAPVYARAHGLSTCDKAYQLNTALKAALVALRTMLTEIQPKRIPRRMTQTPVIIYTDAYFVLHGQRFSTGSDRIPSQWNKTKCCHYENGWGYVIHHAGHTRFCAGRVPAKVIQKFCTRKAYIYFLEILAQMVCFLTLRHHRDLLVISFIDNQPGRYALMKGYCKDPHVCQLVSLTWRLISHLGWHLQLEWVCSELNISDKVSRHDFTEIQAITAHHDTFDFSDLFPILLRAADDSEYANGAALDDLLQLQLQTAASSSLAVWR
jgi:hypothetical protein